MNENIVIGTGESFRAELQSLWMADFLLYVHTLFIAFVVLGLVLVLAGGYLGWRWVRNPWFRYIHLGAIGFVVLQSWLSLPCPLTVWENAYRAEAGDVVYAGSFIAHWVSELIYYEGPPWVFTLVYTLFGLLTLASLMLVRPGSIPGRTTST